MESARNVSASVEVGGKLFIAIYNDQALREPSVVPCKEF